MGGERNFSKFAIEAIEKDGEKLKDIFGLLWELFISVASDPAIWDVICILDALDECQQLDRDTLILRLKQFHEKFAEKWNKSGYSLKFLVTSRPYGDIQRGFGGKTIWLAGEKESTIISQEIALVMDKEIDQIASEGNLSAETRERLKLRLARTPNRSYLWLYLTLKELRTCLAQQRRSCYR
ncbi:hypothetical protein N7488_004639 [Penicillium malachiteum]|nr:hypothetical protein N7488_004639 [Penicillium malachiteum]